MGGEKFSFGFRSKVNHTVGLSVQVALDNVLGVMNQVHYTIRESKINISKNKK